MTAVGEHCVELYTPLLSWLDDFSREGEIQVVAEDVLDISELRVDLPSVQVSKAIDCAWLRWRGLDRQRLSAAADDQGKGRKRKRSSIKISIPRGFDYHTLEPLGQEALAALSHPRIPEDIKAAYLGQINDIFRALPRHLRLQREIDAAGLECMRLKADSDPPVSFSECLTAVQHHALSAAPPAVAADAAANNAPPTAAILQREKSVVVSIQFERPFGSSIQQEINFLGSMTLQDVAKSISCLHDTGASSSSHPSSSSSSSCSVSSATFFFFFIGGILYVPRHLQHGGEKGNVDDTIDRLLKWLAVEQKEDNHETRGQTDINDNDDDDDDDDDDDVFAPPVVRPRRRKSSKPLKSLSKQSRLLALGIADTHTITVRHLEDVKLETVDFKLGCKGLYCHHEHCEHIFSIADVRLLHPQLDGSLSESSPCTTYKARSKVRVCEVCEVWSADFVVYGDRLTTSHVSFFCKFCHHLMHYSKDGKLMSDQITVFPYISDD